MKKIFFISFLFVCVNSFAQIQFFMMVKEPAASDTSTQANTYYVAPWGNDTNPGTSTSPFLTITKANTINSASTILFRKGYEYYGKIVPAHDTMHYNSYGSGAKPSVSDSHFDFAYPDQAGILTLITARGSNISFRSCNFRYYGEVTPMYFDTDANFDHCYTSGQIIKSKAPIINNQ